MSNEALNPDLISLRNPIKILDQSDLLLFEKCKLQCHAQTQDSKAPLLDSVLEKMNACYEIQLMQSPSLYNMYGWKSILFDFPPFKWLKACIIQLTCILVFFIRILFEIVLSLFESKWILPFKSSALFQQLNLRILQVCFWPWEYTQWILSKNKLTPICQAQYIGFYNLLWLIINDIIFGIALAAMLYEHADSVAYAVKSWNSLFLIGELKATIHWLMGWPAGLKLNKELNNFLGDFFLWLIDLWSRKFFHLCLLNL